MPRNEPSVVALEHHHQVRPDAPIGHLLAKTFRHGAEVLADHDAALRHAFLRGRRQQRLERHLHVDAVGGGEPVRHQIEPFQAKHVIEPDRAGMAHRGPQHLAVRLERLQLQPGGVEARKAPVLAGGVERVRRRTDAEMARDRGLLVPGVEAVGLHADGDVEIEPDLHAALERELRQARNCRSAVHCTNSTNSISIASGPARNRHVWHRRALATPRAIPTTACRTCAAALQNRRTATAGAARREILQNPACVRDRDWP